MSLVETLKARVGLLVFTAVGLGVAGYEWHEASAPSLVGTAAAKARASNGSSGVIAEGRVVAYPDADVTLGAEVPGKLVKVAVREREQVKEGDVVAEIDMREQRAALHEAQARVREADSDLAYLEHEHHRNRQLFSENAVASAELDRSAHAAEGAARRRAAALATMARLEAEVDKGTLRAPLGGTVTARFVEPGSYVAPGTSVVSIANLKRLRVQAEIGEFDSARVALGDKVTLRAEGYAESWGGTIEEIPDQVVARQLKPLDPARPVDTRVLLVKVHLDERMPLRLGQRVEVEIRH